MTVENGQFNLPEFEENILKLWEEKHIFDLALARTKKGKPFVFYEGPPTANGSPGIHHVEARAFKDLIPRYKTMRGFFVSRKAGWDTHGLPVEIQVEKELGLKNKQEIETYGIAPFNAKAKESVWRYKEEWDRLTRRMGFWLDLEHPYITYDPLYMESLWWIIKEFWKKKYLYEDFKVVPWCTRCQTGLSTHELAQGYRVTKDLSVFIKFSISNFQFPNQSTTPNAKAFILAWTTTPWTLPGNVALAVNKDLNYVKIESDINVSVLNGAFVGITPGTYILAMDVAWEAMTRGDHPLSSILRILLPDKRPQPGINKEVFFEREKIKGSDLIGLRYEPLFQIPEFTKSETVYHIYPADFVTAEEGTGVVHTAVMYGEDDYKLGKKVGLPTFHTVDETGRFVPSVKELVGLKAKYEETEQKIISLLKERGNLLAVQPYEHDYPHCWRCETPLLYYARKAWWVRTTQVKKQLLENNESINWVPEHLKKGRFGEFLKDVRDWAFSRERYWGTPLPVWRCADCGEIEVIGSIDELRKKSPASRNRYVMMRHGEAVSNIQHITSSKGESHHLTLKGRKQVEVMAKKLSAKGEKQKIDMIVSSPILRAKETAEIVGKILGIAVHVENRLAEINVGVLDGRATKEYHTFFSSMEEKFTKRPPEGEHLGDVRRRILNWMEEMEKKHHGKTILVISHEYPLWMMYAGAYGFTNGQTVGLRTGKRKDDFIAVAEVMQTPYVSLPRDETGEINLHRPFVDECSFSCKACKKGMAKRVPEVVDVWFDSGAMPYAAAHYPFEKEKLVFPADYISEAVDQTRGWFYTLLVISTLLGKKAPYKHVISLGHVLDKNGQKMSKSKGNVVSPWDMIQKYGIDTLRWYFYSINASGEPKRFDEKDLLLKQRSFLGTWWNSFVLFDTYVKKVSAKGGSAFDGKNQKSEIKNVTGKEHVLDVWIKQRTGQIINEVTDKLDSYDITGASRSIEQFVVSDFSQWYLRRSRERFQRPRSPKEKEDAAVTTAYVLDMLCRLTAPFTPFLSEYIYQELRKKTGSKEISVHLLAWPAVESRIKNQESRIITEMEQAREIVAAALKLRAEAGIKVRQPLHTLRMVETTLSAGLLDVIKDEINVKEITFGKDMWLDTVLTPELKEEGMVREFTRNIQEMRRELGLAPDDLGRVAISGDVELEGILTRWHDKIRSDTNLREFFVGGKKTNGNTREIEIDGKKLLVCLSLL